MMNMMNMSHGGSDVASKNPWFLALYRSTLPGYRYSTKFNRMCPAEETSTETQNVGRPSKMVGYSLVVLNSDWSVYINISRYMVFMKSWNSATKTLKGINMTDVEKSMINHESWLIIAASNPNVEWFPCRKAPFSWSAIAHGRSTQIIMPYQ